MSSDLTRPLETPLPGETSLTLWLYLRALGVVYLCAFLSFWVQLDGLVGPQGIWPAEETMEAARATAGLSPLDFPTWCWLSASPTSLSVQAALGVLISLLLILGIANIPIMIGLWSLYLSFATIGRVFMGYQWDNLLLEAGLFAVLLVPLRSFFAHRFVVTPWLVLWLHRLLAFTLIFSSGFVKLRSGDLAWRNLDAMKFHYETQPIPSSLSWYVHQLPAGFHEASVVFVFVLQLAVPFLLFTPRLYRVGGAAMLIGLQLLILLTGNYGFFNLLALALLLTWFDDVELLSLLPKRLGAWLMKRPFPTPPRGKLGFVGPTTRIAAASVLAVLTAFSFAGTLGLRADLTDRAFAPLAPFRSVNGYGLFAVMTTERPEIEIEGSMDGVTYEPYVFRHKSGALDRNPSLIVPHLPRLDWQMWFAALGTADRNPWFTRFLLALLEGRKPVLDLLEHEPFEGRPPRFVRATLWDYRFTTFEEHGQTGHYWRRTERGLYFPPVERPAR